MDSGLKPLQQVKKKLGCLSLVIRALMWAGILFVGLVVLGAGYQTIATELDKRSFVPRGELYPVNGHRMHLVCMGEGSQTVILQAGGAADSLWWYRVQNQLAQHTRVCAYDRPGMGWSEPASTPRDALLMEEELHTLLGAAGVSPPYIMAGHSFGAVWTRIYAAQYPDEVAGIVLVDSTFLIPKQFASQKAFEDWKNSNLALQAPFWAMVHFGLARLINLGIFQNSGYPQEIALELAALQSRSQVFDTNIEEVVTGMLPLTHASAAAENLGELPMIVLWAAHSATAMEQFSAQRAELAAYSTNSATRVVVGADHGSILGSEQYAQQVSDAVLDVMDAVRTSEPLAQ